MKRGLIAFAGLMLPLQLSAQLTAFENGGKWGFKDASGTVVVPANYAGVGSKGIATSSGTIVDVFTEGFAPVTMTGTPTGILNSIENGKWGFVDQKGKLIVPMRYDEVEEFHDGYAVVSSGGRKGLIDKSGKEVIPAKYDRVQNGFSEGLAMVLSGGKWGYVNEAGKEVIRPAFYATQPFSDGLAAVAPQPAKQVVAGTFAFAKFGFIDRSGKLLIPARFDDPLETRNPVPALQFHRGQARVKSEGKTLFIDRNGNTVNPDLINSLNGIYVDSYKGFELTAGTKVLQRDEAKNRSVLEAIGAPETGKSIVVAEGARKVYMLSYKGVAGSDEAYKAVKDYMKLLATYGWMFKKYKLDYGVDKSENVVLNLLETKNGLPDPRTIKMRLIQMADGFEVVIF